MGKSNFSFEKRYLKKGYRLVIGVDEVGRGAFAGPVAAGAAALKSSSCHSDSRFNRGEESHWKISKQRGSFAPTFVGAQDDIEVVIHLGIDDSKKLSPKKREKLEKEIKKYFFWGIGEGNVGEINRLGIVKATERAMRRAIKNVTMKQCNNLTIKSNNRPYRKLKIENCELEIPKRTSFVLVDAFHVKYIPGVGLKNQKAIVHGDQRSISIAAASILAKVYRDTLMQKLALRYRKYHWEKNKGYGTKEHREAIARFGITKLHRRKFVERWLVE